MLTFNHPDLGLIQLRVNSSARRIIFRIKSNVVIITVPPGYEDSVFPLSRETVDNIKKMKGRLDTRCGNVSKFSLDESVQTLTFKVVVVFNENQKLRSYSAKLDDGILTIKVPFGLSIDSDVVQAAIMRIFHKFLRMEAEAYLPVRLDEISRRLGLNYRTVKVDTARSRWGCCSSYKDIKLSFYLMLLPERLVDYVIAHELCHTKEMNHGPNFKALLHGFFLDYKEIEREKVKWDYKVSWLKNKM